MPREKQHFFVSERSPKNVPGRLAERCFIADTLGDVETGKVVEASASDDGEHVQFS
jgi:hypothetical protein